MQNVFSNVGDRTKGYVYDYSKPETFVNNIFYGSKNLSGYTGEEYGGLIDYFEKISYGKMKITPVIVNDMVKKNADDPTPWFRLPKAQKEYAIQFASGVEDYRALGRLHQAAIDIAYKNVDGLDMSDADFLFTIPPITTHGSRSGLAGGDGIDTAFSFQDQSLMLKGTEYEHSASVKTPEGHIIGSAVSVSKNTRTYDGDSYMYRVVAHETSHGLGLIDNYTYEGKDHYAKGWRNPTGPWGIMGGEMTGERGDWFAWDKFKAGWFADEQVKTVLPSTVEQTIRISALGSNEGEYSKDKKMVLLPTELRTIDTFNSQRNRNGINYDFLDYFTPVWLGGQENAEKTFPTGYVLECRRAVGVDEKNTSNVPGTKGILITQLSNLTWETGHGGAGFKVMLPEKSSAYTACIATTGSAYSNNSVWEDKARGIKIEVVASTEFYDDVKITYTGICDSVKRPYQGDLKIDNNYVTLNQNFDVNFNIKTRGVDATNGEPYPKIVRDGSPLAVPQGVSSYSMQITYDPSQVKYVNGGSSEFSSTDIVDDKAGHIAVTCSAIKMIEGNILKLNFQALSTTGSSIIGAELSDVGLLNYEGNNAKVDGVKVEVTGGEVVINPYNTYSISGKITGSVKSKGIDANLQLVNSLGDNVGKPVRALSDGTYQIKNIKEGSGYKIVIGRHGYDLYTTPEIDVTSNLTDKDYELNKIGYTVTGKITGDNIPLEGAIVQLKDFGCSNVGSQVTTEADGTYSIKDVPANRMYSIHVTKEGYGNNKSGLNDVYDNASIDLNMTSTYKISGIISPATSELSATIQLKNKEGKNVGDPVKALASDDEDTRGSYTITNVPKGDGYTLEITMPGYIAKSTTPFNIVSYDVKDKDLELDKDENIPESHIITATVVGGNGTITPNGAVTVEDGKNQNFSYTADNGYEVDKVTVDGKEVMAGAGYVFEAVKGDHTISVSFKAKESIPETHTITASVVGGNGTITPNGAVTVEDGKDQTFNYTADNGYEVDKVTVDGKEVMAGAGYVFEAVKGDHTISVTFRTKSSSNSGSTTSNNNKPVVDKGEINVSGVKVNNGVAQTTITKDILSNALKGAKADANGIKEITLKVEAAKGAEAYKQTLPAAALTSKKPDSKISIVTDIATVELPGDMFADSNVKADSISLSIRSVDKSTLDKDMAEKIGDRPVIELKAYDGNSNIDWRNENAPVTVSFDYKPKNNTELENDEFITVWYIDGKGNAVSVPNAKYDAKTGKITFKTTHFSLYAAAYQHKEFTDLKDFDWAEHNIEVMASKGAIYGKNDTEFNPGANITRADFMSFLVSTLELDAEFTDNFSDVSKTDSFYNAAGIAKKLGIINGIGGYKFDPLKEITRQDLMVMTMRAMEVSNGLEKGSSSDLEDFNDSKDVSDYAKDAVASMIKSGIIKGYAGNINPSGNTSRAEAAVIMYRLYNK